MARSIEPLEELGSKAAIGLNAYAAERAHAIEVARRGFMQAALATSRPAAPRSRYVLALAAMLALALLVGVALRSGTKPLAFTADGRPGSLETWVAAPPQRAVPLHFSDGSSLELLPTSRARVVAVDSSGASVALENGSLSVHVVHRSDSAWRIIAGPLTVRVTGTRFALGWSALREEFTVAVSEGSVAVAGSGFGDERAVRAGETLRVFVAERRLELTNEAQARAASAAAQVAEHSPENASAASSGEALPDSQRPLASSAPASDPEWRELARSGSLRKAFAAADAAGFTAVCREASAAELLALGDGARLAGRADRAKEALLALRKRYPADPRRAAAAFALGKVAFDQTHDYAQAAEWFSTSIREQPSGSLSREASGRLFEALQRSGNAAAARRAAEDYLARYPHGPHAAAARSVVR